MPYPLKQESKKDPWDYKLVESLTGGLNISIRADQIEDKEMLVAKNVVISKEELKKDTGYLPFASGTQGIPQITYQFDRKNGISELLLITTYSMYVLNEAREEWFLIRGDAASAMALQAGAGSSTITVEEAGQFSDGNPIGIVLDDGSQHQTEIVGSPVGAVITLADPIPVGRTADVGAAVVQGVKLTGSLDFQVVGVVMVSHDWFVFTNGVNVVRRYDGIDCVTVPGLPTEATIVARALALYNNSLFLINTIEFGESHPRRVRRCDSGDPLTWDEGIAGFNDLMDEEDDLLSAELLGPYLIIYSERSLIRGEFVGTGGVNYDFHTMVRGEGSISTMSVADVGERHLVMCQSNIYEYRGGFEMEPIGDNIYYRLYGSRSEMSPSLKHRAFCFYVEELDEVWFFYPSTTAIAGCNRLVRYNVGEKVWTEREFLDEFIGFGFFQSRGSRPWTSLIGSWAEQKWRWNERTLLSASPTTHLCPANLSQVMEYDYVQPLDNGQPIPYTVETKDFTTPSDVARHDMFEFGFRGQEVLVEASTDEGLSWVPLGTASSNVLKRERMHLQFPFERVRFRWSGIGEFLLTWFGFSFREESEA